MNKGIIVEMPGKLYISYDSKRTLENEFYFIIYKEYRKTKKLAKNILLSPQIFIRGFGQLLKVPQKTPEEQEAQLKAAAKQFLGNLSLEPGWSADYVYDRETENLAIVLACTEEDLPEDFKVKLFTDSFLCHYADTHEPVVLTIHTEGFAQLFGEEDYMDYQISLQAVYAPCITEFKIRCGGDDYGNRLYVNPQYDNPVTLHWKIMGNGKLEHTLQKGNLYLPEAPAVDEIEDQVTCPVVYTLQAENRKGFSDMKQIEVKLTGWHKAGNVEGLPFGLAGIAKYRSSYFSYKHPVLYQSGDGCQWVEYSRNTETAQESFPVTNCGIFENKLYVMAGTVGGRLRVFAYDFAEKTWENTHAHQYCISENAHMAFSKEYHYYGQTQNQGMIVAGYNRMSTSRHWNECMFSITTEEESCYSDLCFWRDRFYAVILCKNKWFYVYECKEELEDAIFSYHVGEVAPIRLLPTTNRLFILVNGKMFDLVSRKELDEFVPSNDKAPICLGSDKRGLYGIFSDKNFWVYQ